MVKTSFSVLGKRQDTQIMKFNSHPYTLSLQCPSYSKFSQVLYEPNCSQMLQNNANDTFPERCYVKDDENITLVNLPSC